VLRKFLLWFVGVLVLLAVFTLLRGHLGGLIIVSWCLVGIAWQVIRSGRPRPVDANIESAPARIEDGNNFDPEFCGRIQRATAIGLIAILVLELIFFSVVQSDKCPGWQAPSEKQSGSVWVVWCFVAIWALYISYRAVTWRRESQKILEETERARKIYVPGTNPTLLTDPEQFKAMCTVKNNMNTTCVVVLIGSAVFVALPVLTRLGCF
jgi:hypothetical protein